MHESEKKFIWPVSQFRETEKWRKRLELTIYGYVPSEYGYILSLGN